MESLRAMNVAIHDTIYDSADEQVWYVMDIVGNIGNRDALWFTVLIFTGGHVNGPVNVGPYNQEDGGFYLLNRDR